MFIKLVLFFYIPLFHLTAGVDVWGNTPDIHLYSLIKLQKIIIRITYILSLLSAYIPKLCAMNSTYCYFRILLHSDRIALQMFKFTTVSYY